MHTLILAQALPDPSGPAAVGWVIGALVAIGGFLLMFRKVFGHEPPLHKEYVTKADHDAFRNETNAELKRHAARRAEIYDVQKEHSEKLARIETQASSHSQDLGDVKRQIQTLDKRVDEVPQRTISLLLDAQKVTAKR